MDPQQQQTANALAGMGAGVLVFAMIFVFAVLAFLVFCLWRIFTKAGLTPALSLLVFVPGIGGIIVLCILAFSDWKVAPIATGYPPQYPPSNYPPSGPPAQY